ncbi:hypothetical protein ADUPG1_010946 [Aduncisulcus paluster]|uniref:Uncharacterized protein n=2 Tax=Aduncisulcus paluster TaxID=2918883 RepID=A0ABQ5JTY2_9EUKA|nr:hypothetical protein ADUPG1_010946 [Aduncisulcus paluster]
MDQHGGVFASRFVDESQYIISRGHSLSLKSIDKSKLTLSTLGIPAVCHHISQVIPHKENKYFLCSCQRFLLLVSINVASELKLLSMTERKHFFLASGFLLESDSLHYIALLTNSRIISGKISIKRII